MAVRSFHPGGSIIGVLLSSASGQSMKITFFGQFYDRIILNGDEREFNLKQQGNNGGIMQKKLLPSFPEENFSKVLAIKNDEVILQVH